MKITERIITPEIAREILKNNTCNRKINWNTVDFYAKAMKEGRWEKDNPEGCLIVLDKNGVLKDGQHRLNAIIKSGASILFFVAVCDENVTHFDEQKNRSATDFLVLSGVNISRKATAAASIVLAIKSGLKNERCQKINRDELRDFTRANQEYLEFCEEITSARGHKSFCCKQGVMAAVYFALKAGENKDKLKRFCRAANMCTYNDYGDNTALVFRRHIEESKNMSPYEIEEITETYISKYCSGEELERRVKRINRTYFESVKLFI